MTREQQISKLLSDYKKETGKRGFILNRYTREFKTWNLKKLKNGETNIVAFTNDRLYNRNTGEADISRKDIYKKDGQIKKAINNNLDNLLNYLNPSTARYLITTTLNGQSITYTLTPDTIKKLKKLIAQGGVVMYTANMDSESEIVLSWNTREPFTLTILGESTKSQGSGGFFGYNHNMDKVDLSRYGIYTTKQQDEDDTIYDINCICECLINSGLDITNIKHLIKNRNIPQKDLKLVADIMGICISLRYIKNEKKKNWYGDRKLKEIKIGNINDHYFLIEPTQYTSYSIKNYHNINDERDFNKIINKKGHKRDDKFIDSYNLIKLLFIKTQTTNPNGKVIDKYDPNKKYLIEMKYGENIYKSIYHNKINGFGSLEYNEENNTKLNERRKPQTTTNLRTIFFDFETTTDGKVHRPYCVYTDIHDGLGFWGRECGKKLLDSLCKQYGINKEDERYEDVIKHKIYITLIAHNCGYDFRFLMEHIFYGLSTIEKNNSLMSGKALYYSNGKCISLNLRCSQKLINMKLDKFGKCFNLKTEKEIMPYDLYTEENIKKKYIPLKECIKHIKIKDKEQYIKNLKRWDCLDDDDDVDIHKYAGQYCYMDCITLRDGYNKFGELVKEATGQDILDYISLASMSNDYLLNNGCFDGVYKLSGVPRHFIQKCVVGGRCMTRENKKIKVDDGVISDFDAVSLYPSAMARMRGFLKGRPKVIKNFEPEKYDGYFIEIKITKIKKRYKFPPTSVLNENGIRNFTNDIEGQILYVDRTMLEDYINFMGIEYEFIKGYYYDEGHNKTINKVMEHLFNQRLKYKKLNNPIQMVFKELMNSAYGKTIQKPIETDKEYISINKKEKYIDYHYNNIKSMTLCDNNKIIRVEKMKPIDKHFNNVVCGVEVLSMSKRIMNEVMTLAEDNNINMYTTDTDSIHMDMDKVELIRNKFNEKYGRELIGKEMGQFHCDFEMDGMKKGTDPVAIKSIFLGKKMYCDYLKGINENGDEIYDYHIRLKGIPNDCIIDKAEKEYDGDIMRIYEDLYNEKYTGTGDTTINNWTDTNKGLSFNLIACRPKFEFHNNMTISSKTNFMRRINTKYDEYDSDDEY